MKICINSTDITLLNVYLPYYSFENYDEYLFYIGKIGSIFDQFSSKNVMCIGDFNADIGKDYYREWQRFNEDEDLIFSDVSL